MILDAIFKILCAMSALLFVNKLIFDGISRVKSKVTSTGNTWFLLILDAAYMPLQFCILIFGIYRIANLFEYQFIMNNIDHGYQVSMLMVMSWFLLRFKQNIEHVLDEEKEYLFTKFDPALVTLFSQIIKVTIIFCVVAIALYIVGIPFQSLMMLQGAVTIALGVSAQNVLGNGFGGIMILLYKPFEIGDLISSPDKKIEGYVEEIRWDRTRIMNLDRRPLSIPNSMFNQIIIVNASKMRNRHLVQNINLSFKDINKIDAITTQIQAMLKSHDGIDTKLAASAHLVEFGAQSLRIHVSAFTKTVKTSVFYQVQQDICIQIAQIIKNNEAEIVLVANVL